MENKVLFGIMTLIFNCVGVPQFMKGDIGKGILHIVLTLCTCGVGEVVLFILGLIEGIKILKMSDAEYGEKYLGKAPAAVAEEAPAAEVAE